MKFDWEEHLTPNEKARILDEIGQYLAANLPKIELVPEPAPNAQDIQFRVRLPEWDFWKYQMQEVLSQSPTLMSRLRELGLSLSYHPPH